MVSHCSFNLHFLDDMEHLFMCLFAVHIACFFGIQIFCQTLFLLLWEGFERYESFARYIIYRYFSQPVFHPLYSVFHVAKFKIFFKV